MKDKSAPQGDGRWEEFIKEFLSDVRMGIPPMQAEKELREAFAQVAAEVREEAALAVETMPSTGFLAAKRIRALKSPKKESK